MSDAILELRKLSKRYGDYLAVDELSLEVPRGAVYGLLGPNGAGKTTTIRMIMRIIAPDSGEVLLDGRPVDDDRRRLIGYLPEERGLYRKMKVLEHLVYLGTIRGVSPGESRKRASAWLERLELADWAAHKVEDLSKGMQQKMQLIGTLLHRPRLLILDEPFSGLDPINTRALKDLLLEMANDGVTVVLSTHVLPQVDEMCTHICLINRAREILAGTLEEIRAEYGGNVWRVRTELAAEAVAGLPGVVDMRRDEGVWKLVLEKGRDTQALLRTLTDAGQVSLFSANRPSLNEIFLTAVNQRRGVIGAGSER